MHYVTSDLHSYSLESFRKLLDKAGFSNADELYILGDVIDRNGDGGIGVLRWIMAQPNVRFLLGNHEDMLLRCDFLFDEITEASLGCLTEPQLSALMNWQANGARPTMNALSELWKNDSDALHDLLDFITDAPLYAELNVCGRHYILTHAGLGNYALGKELFDYSDHDLLWFRPELTTRYAPDATVVFGHAPTLFYGEKYKGRMIRTDTWINIDTGAAAGLHPMLLRLEDERPFYADD